MTEEQRLSIAPSLARASVATTLYRDNAIVSPMPAQAAILGRPAVVSVKSGSTTPGSKESQQGTTPPVPQLPAIINGSSVVGRNLTPRSEARKASPGPNVPTLANLVRAASADKRTSIKSTTSDSKFLEEKEVVVNSSPNSFDSPILKQQLSYASFGGSSSYSSVAPGNTPLQVTLSNRNTADLDLNARIENAMMKAARDPMHMIGERPKLLKQDSGPFSDANEVKENMKE